MSKFTLFVACLRSESLRQHVKSSLKLITDNDVKRAYLSYRPYQVPCSYTLTGRTSLIAYRAIDISDLSLMQPENKSTALIVKDTGSLIISHPHNKDTKVKMHGEELFGHCIYFTKRDKVNRNDKSPSAPAVACIKLLENFMGLPTGTNIRVPIDCVCRIQFVKK